MKNGGLEGFSEKVIAKQVSIGDDRELASKRREGRIFWAEVPAYEQPIFENQTMKGMQIQVLRNVIPAFCEENFKYN